MVFNILRVPQGRRRATSPPAGRLARRRHGLPAEQAATSRDVRVHPPRAPIAKGMHRANPCQTPDDYRPNKALLPATLMQQCRGYPKLGELVTIASEGVRVHLQKTPPKPSCFPRNHPSASTRLNVLRKNIRKEQDLLRCLVVDADIIRIWPEIVISPFGVVDKGSGDPRITGRTIHDLSFPEDESVNHCTDPTSIPKATFEHCSSLAREITRCKQADPGCDVKVMAGDVAAAYRNACIHSQSVHLFGGHIPEDNAIIIDMSAAFGWSGSAGIYSVLGGAVAYVHGCSSDAGRPSGFFNYHWVDDHVNVAADTGSRCTAIERSLRFAMISIMGPAAVNEEKFTPWRTRQQVLGLIFDTSAGTVAMPSAKITKARRRVEDALPAPSLTRSEFRSLIGSLRHVATCIRPAQAFLQRLRSGEIRLHRHSRVPISAAMRDDLAWWWRILHDPALNGVPIEYFGDLPEPDVVVSTDASDVGLCALVPALRLALTYQFSPPELSQIEAFKRGTPNEFDINYRELLACAFALQAWSPAWRAAHKPSRPLHVHFRVDNTSAIAWQTKMASRNSRAQVLIRLLSLWEQEFGLRGSASHIPGVDNTAADAGSRRWENASYALRFDDFTQGWQHTPPLPSIAAIEAIWLSISENTPSLIPRTRNTLAPSRGGSNGQDAEASRGKSTPQPTVRSL